MRIPLAYDITEQNFAAMVRDHQSMVFSLAYYFLRDGSLAEELAQEVFLDLYRNLTSIESPAHLLFWLRKVTTRRSIDYARRRQRHSRVVSLDQVAEPSTAPKESDPMLSASLRKLVAALPERVRAIVILRYQEEMEPAAIAQLLDIPVNTVKSRLHRSLEFLRGKLERTQREVRS